MVDHGGPATVVATGDATGRVHSPRTHTVTSAPAPLRPQYVGRPPDGSSHLPAQDM
jgi:hypothetical protein